MIDRSKYMLNIFNKLSEQNKDIIILIAKSIRITQNTDKQIDNKERNKKRKRTNNNSLS